jgi:hypothetical protein
MNFRQTKIYIKHAYHKHVLESKRNELFDGGARVLLTKLVLKIFLFIDSYKLFFIV